MKKLQKTLSLFTAAFVVSSFCFGTSVSAMLGNAPMYHEIVNSSGNSSARTNQNLNLSDANNEIIRLDNANSENNQNANNQNNEFTIVEHHQNANNQSSQNATTGVVRIVNADDDRNANVQSDDIVNVEHHQNANSENNEFTIVERDQSENNQSSQNATTGVVRIVNADDDRNANRRNVRFSDAFSAQVLSFLANLQRAIYPAVKRMFYPMLHKVIHPAAMVDPPRAGGPQTSAGGPPPKSSGPDKVIKDTGFGADCFAIGSAAVAAGISGAAGLGFAILVRKKKYVK